jgi:hypothetical protein
LKSNVSDYLEVALCVYIDATSKCVADVSDLRDLLTIKSRVKEEGVSFLTITLPEFGKSFERSLASGHVSASDFRNFRKSKAIPAFLQGMLGRIFDRETGRIYDESSTFFNDIPLLVDCVRQICHTFKKLELECTPKRVHSALEKFITIEQSFEMFSLPREELSFFKLVSSVLWDNMLWHLRPSMFVPRHGPGATAERISGNQKYVWKYWYDRLEPYFPLFENAYFISAFESEEFHKLSIISKNDELPVRVITVPKTLKSPRIIAIEPCCMQYAQQGIRDALYKSISSYWLTAGHVNFNDQTVNQRLALQSSIDGQLATIDLSDASDRVPLSLVREMFRCNPDLWDSIDSCRSTKAELMDGRIIPSLQKFASMGSALCFPIEAMYFYTICVMASLRFHNLPVSASNIFTVTRRIYVYGDDIIVPTDQATAVLDYLQNYNCKVNTDKTFLTGRFRESCGVDAYRGELVTPTYLNKVVPKNRQQASSLISWISTANLFYKKGYWRTASYLFKKCEAILGALPFVSETSEALGRVTFHGYRSIKRWNPNLHRFEVKAWTASPIYRTDIIGGNSALFKSLSKLEGLETLEDSRDSKHLERSALHGAVTLKRRWVPAY